MDFSTTGGYLLCHKPFLGGYMTSIPLADFVGQHGQGAAAKKLGVSQAAISKAIRSGRHVLVWSHACGSLDAIELKPFPCGGARESLSADLELIMSAMAGLEEPPEVAVDPSSIGG